jgi:hypothetical protein
MDQAFFAEGSTGIGTSSVAHKNRASYKWNLLGSGSQKACSVESLDKSLKFSNLLVYNFPANLAPGIAIQLMTN